MKPCPTRPELVKAIGDYAEAYHREETSSQVSRSTRPGRAKETKKRQLAGEQVTEMLDRLYGRLADLERLPEHPTTTSNR